MKKIITFIIVLIAFCFFSVNASSVPYQWIVDGEKVNVGSNNPNASLVKEGTKVELTLKNYHGKSLKLDCYGTGQSGLDFSIVLVGENSIDSDNIAIDMGEEKDNELKFAGDGKLTINASVPISNKDYLYIEPSLNIISSDKKDVKSNDDTELVANNDNNGETIENSEPEENLVLVNETVEKDDSQIMYICFTIFAVICLIVIAILAYLLVKKKNNYKK